MSVIVKGIEKHPVSCFECPFPQIEELLKMMKEK